MANFPHELVFDVLSRLPVKSVLRFKCVCKSWCSLISEHQFVKAHLNRAITDITVIEFQSFFRVFQGILNETLESIDYEALQLLSKKELRKAWRNNGGNAYTMHALPWGVPKDHHVRFVGCCHGIVCMVDGRDKIVLCNPCTREFRELPKPASINFENTIHGGVGYDSYVDDYKFVIAVRDGSDCQFKVEVFSLRNNSWRIIQDIPPDIFFIYGIEQGVYLNGALHWIAICETGQQIMSFSLATEKFQKLMSLPPSRGDKRISEYDQNLMTFSVLAET